MSDALEVAKELTLAIIPKINAVITENTEARNQSLAEEIGKAYRTIYKAVTSPNK